jgi:DNA invertase Pin-like site-specific DNA recombinase
MRVRAYIRESTERQGEKFGPDAQRAAILAACAKLELPEPGAWYTDLITGTGKILRDQLARAIAEGRDYDVFVCYDTSRWARNERDAFNFEYDMKQAGVRIYFASEGFWADDEDRKANKGMLHVFNAEFSRQLSRKIRDGIRAKRSKGGHHGQVPWGYRRVGLTLEPNELYPHRMWAWEQYATGDYTVEKVSNELRRRGVAAPNRSCVAAWFNSDLDLAHGLDPEVHKRVREVLARHRINEHVGQRRHQYLFVAIARCATCGETFHGHTKKDHGKTYRQLTHPARGCRKGSRNEEKLERAFGEWLQTWKLPDNVREQIKRYRASDSREKERDARRHAIETELDRLTKMFRWGHITEAAYLPEAEGLRRELQQLGPEAVPAPLSEDALTFASRIGDAWNLASIETKRRFLAEWFTELRFGKGTVDVVPRESVQEIVLASVAHRTSDISQPSCARAP